MGETKDRVINSRSAHRSAKGIRISSPSAQSFALKPSTQPLALGDNGIIIGSQKWYGNCWLCFSGVGIVILCASHKGPNVFRTIARFDLGTQKIPATTSGLINTFELVKAL
jgi:hypothetical protein